jgi:pimeloyl-ACP methyl ester carboxylesterase
VAAEAAPADPRLAVTAAAWLRLIGAIAVWASLGGAMPAVTSRDGTTIAYQTRGEGPPLILVDGTLGSRAVDFFSALQRLLSEDPTVYRYDRRGRNESGDTPPYAVEREIEDLEALIDQAGGSAFVYGISSGAALALEAAARLGSGGATGKIARLALYEPPYGSPRMVADGPDDYYARLDRLLAAGMRAEAVELFVSGVRSPEGVARLRGTSTWDAMVASAHTLAYDAAVINHAALPRERAATIAVPTLVMNGAASWDYMRSTAMELARIIPNARYQEIPDQPHEPAARALAPYLADFFREGRSARAS